jgi:hypothetical protein
VEHETSAVRRKRSSRITPIVLAAGLLVTIAGCSSGGDSGYTPPTPLTITAGPYHAGQRINLSVGPNKYFTPYSGIKILECADPGGTAKHLPTNVSACDGNTIQPGSVIINQDGSFSFRGYPVYQLPNGSQLDEPSDSRPLCNATHQCVLYIGQNQEKFTAPKLFSPPFTVTN